MLNIGYGLATDRVVVSLERRAEERLFRRAVVKLAAADLAEATGVSAAAFRAFLNDSDCLHFIEDPSGPAPGCLAYSQLNRALAEAPVDEAAIAAAYESAFNKAALAQATPIETVLLAELEVIRESLDSSGIVLALPALQTSDGLFFASRRTPIFGRARERDAVDDFVRDGGGFAWWVLVGAAGMGKSRLALEICLGLGESWECGFVRGQDEESLLRFVPERPTLLVIDYASARAEWLGKLLLDLTERAEPNWPALRVLVLERDAAVGLTGISWFATATRQGSMHDRERIRSTLFDEPLRLDGIDRDAMVELVEAAASNETLPPVIETIVDRTFEIAPDGVPLFGLVATHEHFDPNISGGGRDELLRSLVGYRLAQDLNLATSSRLLLAVVSTVLGGIGLAELSLLAEIADTESVGFPDLALSTSQDIEALLSGLAPDILGEIWVLDGLASDDLAGSIVKGGMQTAWIHSPPRYAAFVDRCVRDHPGHEAIPELLSVRADHDLGQWFQIVPNTIKQLRDPDSPVPAAVLAALESQPIAGPDAEELREFARLETHFHLANLLMQTEGHGRRTEARDLYALVTSANSAPVRTLFAAHTNKGIVEEDLGNRAEAQIDWAFVIASTEASDEAKACCLNNRADLHDDEGIHFEAINDRTAVLQLADTSHDRRYIALIRRAAAWRKVHRHDRCEADLDAILATDDIAVEQKMETRLVRARWALDLKDYAKARSDLTIVKQSRRNFLPVLEEAEQLLAGLPPQDRD